MEVRGLSSQGSIIQRTFTGVSCAARRGAGYVSIDGRRPLFPARIPYPPPVPCHGPAPESPLPSIPLTSGRMLVHGNHPEALRDLLVTWIRRYPLAPLETETVLVHSNGIAQWLRLALAEDGGRDL